MRLTPIFAAIWIAVSCLPAVCLAAGEPLFGDGFENGLDSWRLDSPEQFEILTEPGTSNHVLQLTSKLHDFAHLILAESVDWTDIRFEGRFLFPTEGDGYLGFLYNYRETPERTDFGCLYVKSNGSYVRASPHYDGNPSWRLYPELQVDLEGERRIRTGTWYAFRLDVRGRRAELFIEDMTTPLLEFDSSTNSSGAIGLEPRPGRGEPVWVDDIRVSRLDPAAARPVTTGGRPESTRSGVSLEWEILAPRPPIRADASQEGDLESALFDPPELPADGWETLMPDERGALITGRYTQFRSGDDEIAYLRAHLDPSKMSAPSPTWLAVSSANRLDVWLNGVYRGTIAPEEFIWADYLLSREHPGARLPIQLDGGDNELLVRVHGGRFAGGGLYAALVGPQAPRKGCR